MAYLNIVIDSESVARQVGKWDADEVLEFFEFLASDHIDPEVFIARCKRCNEFMGENAHKFFTRLCAELKPE